MENIDFYFVLNLMIFVCISVCSRLIACGLVCSVLNSLRLKVKSSKRKKDESGVKLWKNAKAVLSKLDAEVVIQQELKGHAMSEELRSVLLSMACPLSEALSSLDGNSF